MKLFFKSAVKWMSIGLMTIILNCLSCHLLKAQGFLRVNGQHLQNDNNKNFIIRAMGLGGWMLQEGYMFRLGFLGQQHKIKEKISAMVGKEAADHFYDQWLNLHTQKADIDSMAAWGFNAIRLPMHYGLLTLPVAEEPVPGKNTWLPKGFALIDSLLDWCKQAHIYLILDLHAAPGGQGNDLPISDRYPDQPSLWQSKANQDKTVALWAKLAKRYKNEPYIGGYDILNETNWGFDDSTDIRGTKEQTNKPLRDLFIRITEAIRKQDQNHIIYLEGNGFANNYNGLFPLWDDNMVLSFHKYGNFTTQATIRKFLDYRKKYNVPLWLGESGENSNNWFTGTIKLMENNNIGWAWWQLKKMGINNPLEIKIPAHYQSFIDFCENKGPKPDKVSAQNILNELLRNIQLKNNIYHRDVIDAMFRQVQQNTSIPFKPNRINSGDTFILAADYDLGANSTAYNDLDTARYQYTPGVKTEGNRGHKYRNDGVDIRYDSRSRPVVFHIEAGEWLKFTTEVLKTGKYEITFDYQPGNLPGKIRLQAGTDATTRSFILDGTASNSFKESAPQIITLSKGAVPIKIIFETGGFQLRGFNLKAL